MQEQRVKVVDFDVCQNAPKLIGYHIRPLSHSWPIIVGQLKKIIGG